MGNILRALLRIIASLFGRKGADAPPSTSASPTVSPPATPEDGGAMPPECIAWAAVTLQADEAAVKAVLEVESAGKAMVRPGRAVIRFEGATFGKYTNHRFDESHPTLSMRSWRENNKHVRGGDGEWDRLLSAADLDRDAAYKSASYGAAQIMGFNYETAGYPSVDAFVNDMNMGHDGQIRAFVQFVQGRGLAGALRLKDWHAFAVGYNGTGQPDHYAQKLTEAYNRHARLPAGTETPPTTFQAASRWDDYGDIPIDLWRARWPNFTPAEIGGKPQDPNDRSIIVVPEALDALQALRREWGRPITINSGYRSPAYNSRIGGAAQSKHMDGIAFDCAMPAEDQAEFIAMAERHGFNGIGAYSTFVHIDTRPDRARW
ncbi:MAG: N-acetylmuramidase domain-containing protein [Pseudomonadota bacterium]